MYLYVTHIIVYTCLEMEVFAVFNNQLQKMSKTCCSNKWWKPKVKTKIK